MPIKLLSPFAKMGVLGSALLLMSCGADASLSVQWGDTDKPVIDVPKPPVEGETQSFPLVEIPQKLLDESMQSGKPLKVTLIDETGRETVIERHNRVATFGDDQGRLWRVDNSLNRNGKANSSSFFGLVNIDEGRGKNRWTAYGGGASTPKSEMPKQGAATYQGVASVVMDKSQHYGSIGQYPNQVHEGKTMLTVDFGNRSLKGDITLPGNQGKIDLNGAITGNKFDGTASTASDTATLNGQFNGNNAKELSGAFNSSKENGMAGSFAAEKR